LSCKGRPRGFSASIVEELAVEIGMTNGEPLNYKTVYVRKCNFEGSVGTV